MEKWREKSGAKLKRQKGRGKTARELRVKRHGQANKKNDMMD